MTLLELYEYLIVNCKRTIKNEFGKSDGLCYVVGERLGFPESNEMEELFELMENTDDDGYLPRIGEMTPLRETLLLLFAAYKGEL